MYFLVFVCNFTGATKPGSHVDPGEHFTYIWHVLDGPSPSDPACISSLYYSAVDPVKDTNSGLVGPLIVCKKGALGKDGMEVCNTDSFPPKFTHLGCCSNNS